MCFSPRQERCRAEWPLAVIFSLGESLIGMKRLQNVSLRSSSAQTRLFASDSSTLETSDEGLMSYKR